MLPGGLGSGGGGRGGGGLCLLRWLGLRLWSRRGTLVFALLWFGSWLFLNGLVLVHRTILSDFCTDDKSKRILQRLVSQSRPSVSTGVWFLWWGWVDESVCTPVCGSGDGAGPVIGRLVVLKRC